MSAFQLIMINPQSSCQVFLVIFLFALPLACLPGRVFFNQLLDDLTFFVEFLFESLEVQANTTMTPAKSTTIVGQ